ncbi:MAG TPA: carbon-nitrogen hydrolase family protein [Gaiellales bacterium]
MATFPTVRVAAVQATPVMLDGDACIDLAIDRMRTAAAEGAQLIVLPECFVPFYPKSWLTVSNWGSGQTALYERMWMGAVDVPGPYTDRLAAACADLSVHLAIGVNERESDRPGTLYNTLLLFGPGGLLHKHRKLMPTHHERLFHGIGAGDDLAVTETPIGRIGGLVCWENFMPLARYTLYRHGPQIWVAPTMDDRDIWTALMRTIAFESGAWVIGVTQYQHRSQFPADLPVELPADRPDEFSRGGTVIVEAGSGEVVAGPLYGGEGMLIHDCDLRVGLRAKQGFDAVGHYGREDVLLDLLTGPRAAQNGAAVAALAQVPAPAEP